MGNNTLKLCKEYLKHRYEIRVEQLDGAIMILRVIMLARKIKLPGYTFVTKILYSCCGLISTLLAAYKMVLDQPVLLELKEKERKDDDLETRFETIGSVKRVQIGRTGSLQFD